MSDLDDFTFYKAGPGMTAVLEVMNPLDGTGSLLMSRGTATASYMHGVRNTGNRAFTSGRARWTTAPHQGGNSSQNRFGFLFQQSQLDLTSTTGQAYAVTLHGTSTQEDNPHVEIVKFSAGLASAPTTLASGNVISPAGFGIRIAMEVIWLLDLVQLGGMRITTQRGTLADFSDLAPELDILVTTDVLLTSVGEGPMLRLTNTTTDASYVWDSMSCIPLLVT